MNQKKPKIYNTTIKTKGKFLIMRDLPFLASAHFRSYYESSIKTMKIRNTIADNLWKSAMETYKKHYKLYQDTEFDFAVTTQHPYRKLLVNKA